MARVAREVSRPASVGTCVGGGFKGGGFPKHVIASCLYVATALFAMYFRQNISRFCLEIIVILIITIIVIAIVTCILTVAVIN